MTKEKTMTVRPYDHEVADDVFGILFYGSDNSTEDGLLEIPAVSYQLVVSALELIRWEVPMPERDAVKAVISICEDLRDKQFLREWARKNNA